MNATFISSIKTFIAKHNLIAPNSTIVLGLSGGPDSVFLLHFLTHISSAYNLTIIAAHLDHAWRAESYKDAEFCAALCKELNVTYVVQKLSDLKLTFKLAGSKEEYARKARRFFFQTVAKQYNADAIALGHHLQDQEETFFIRLIRGTTLSGLSAMRPKAEQYIRPLLETNKHDIVTYLEQHTLPFLIDPTNIHETFLRNRIRHNVIPALQECDPRFDKNFLRTVYAVQKADEFLEKTTKILFDSITTYRGATLQLDKKKLFKQDPYIQNRLIMLWLVTEDVPFTPTESFLDEIKRFLEQPESKEHTLHQNWSLVKQKDTVYIRKIGHA